MWRVKGLLWRTGRGGGRLRVCSVIVLRGHGVRMEVSRLATWIGHGFGRVRF